MKRGTSVSLKFKIFIKGGNITKRIKLKILRVQHDLSQSQMAEKLGCTPQFYSLVELGKRKGKEEFWKQLKHEFNLSAAEVWCIQNNEEE